MSIKIYLWSQHLNNVSPDIIADVTDEYKHVVDTNNRNRIISTVSEVTSTMKTITKRSLFCTAYLLNQVIVFDVESDDLDSGGRKSNITGYYKGYELSAQSGWNDLIEKIRVFAAINNRVISEEALADLVICLNSILEKKKSLKVRRLALVTGLVVLSLLTAILLYQNCRERLESSTNGVINEQSNHNTH